jgi:hypothetical protein
VIRALATVVGAALVLSGCSTLEAKRAQELLQEAGRAQAQLRSVAFEAELSATFDGQRVRLALEGAASKEGAAFSVAATGIPGEADQSMRMVVRGDRAWTNDGTGWEAVPVPPNMKTQVGGLSGSMGADAFGRLAEHVQDVRVAENQEIGGKVVTTIAGEIDTSGLLEAVSKLGAQTSALPFDVDDLGLEIGDIEAVLSIDERTRLLDSALVRLTVEAQGEKLELELRYRLTSANEPIALPAPA